MARFDLNNYVDCQERITRFWEQYPEGRIQTELMSLPDEFERVVFRASIYKQFTDGMPSATGWAAEVAGTQGANQTSWHENCETSAIGRALANMGYAKSGADRPSRQEMQKANRGPAPRVDAPREPESQPDPASVNLATPPQLKNIERLVTKLGKDRQKIKAYYRIEHLADLSKAQASQLIERFMAEAGETQQSMPMNAAVGASGETGNDARTR